MFVCIQEEKEKKCGKMLIVVILDEEFLRRYRNKR